MNVRCFPYRLFHWGTLSLMLGGSLLYKHQMYILVLILQLDLTRERRSLAWEGGQIRWHLYVGITPSTPEVELAEGERQYWFCRPYYPKFSIWGKNPRRTPSLVSNPGMAPPEYEWAEMGTTEGKWAQDTFIWFSGLNFVLWAQKWLWGSSYYPYLVTSPQRGSYSAKADSEMFLSLASLVSFLLNLAHCL